MDFPYPLPNFYFAVKFAGVDGARQLSFAEVSGLEFEHAVVENSEGGESRYVHRLPGRAKFGNLVLKRGVMRGDSALCHWCRGVFESDQSVSPKDLELCLFDASGVAVRTWNVSGAWPVKWSISQRGSDKSVILVDTLELAYAHITCS